MKYAMLLLAIGLLALPVFAQEAGNETAADNETVMENDTNVTTDSNETEVPEEDDDGPLQAGPKGKVNVSAYENVTNYTALFEATCTSEEEAEAGVAPGNFLYGFKRFFENVDKFFTMDKGEKAKKHAKYGKLRAVEAHLMTCKAKAQSDAGDDEAAEESLETAEELAEDSIEEQTSAETELEAAVEDGSANETEVEEVQNYTRNSIIVLQRVYEKAPEAAKDGLLRALNNSIANYEKHQEKMESKGKGGDDDEDENETDNETSSSGPGKGKGKGQSGGDDDNETESDDDGNETVSSGKGKPSDAGSSGKGKGNGGSSSDDESEEEEESEDD